MSGRSKCSAAAKWVRIILFLAGAALTTVFFIYGFDWSGADFPWRVAIFAGLVMLYISIVILSKTRRQPVSYVQSDPEYSAHHNLVDGRSLYIYDSVGNTYKIVHKGEYLYFCALDTLFDDIDKSFLEEIGAQEKEEAVSRLSGALPHIYTRQAEEAVLLSDKRSKRIALSDIVRIVFSPVVNNEGTAFGALGNVTIVERKANGRERTRIYSHAYTEKYAAAGMLSAVGIECIFEKEPPKAQVERSERILRICTDATVVASLYALTIDMPHKFVLLMLLALPLLGVLLIGISGARVDLGRNLANVIVVLLAPSGTALMCASNYNIPRQEWVLYLAGLILAVLLALLAALTWHAWRKKSGEFIILILLIPVFMTAQFGFVIGDINSAFDQSEAEYVQVEILSASCNDEGEYMMTISDWRSEGGKITIYPKADEYEMYENSNNMTLAVRKGALGLEHFSIAPQQSV